MPSPEDLVEKLREAIEAGNPKAKGALDELRQIDPERYRRLAQPFENENEFNEALKGFFKELGVLREKYKIPDVLVAAIANVKNEKDPELIEQRMSSMQYDNTALRPFIILSLYRQEHPMLQALIEGLAGTRVKTAEEMTEAGP